MTGVTADPDFLPSEGTHRRVSMRYEIRPVPEARFAEFVEVADTAFGEEATEEGIRRFRAITELDRTVTAFDGDDIVGTNSSFAFDMTVPGGELPTAGVTIVGVLPTHRRQGILRAMMQYQLDDVRRRKEPLAILWASEGNIYQRFGYGTAARMAFINVLKERATFLDSTPAAGQVKLLSPEESLHAIPPIYDQVRARTPGMYRRNETWWEEHSLYDRKDIREGASPLNRAVWTNEGAAQAYATYRVKNDWDDDAGAPTGFVRIRELHATSLLALREMWRYVFGIDLVVRIKAFAQPMDDPLFFMMAEPRRLQTQLEDGLWLRVVDVRSALEGRTYAADGELGFALRDDFCPWNEGRYTLEVKSGEARLSEAAGEVDLELSARELGACYLGGTPLTALAGAGRVRENTPGAARKADLMFYSEVTPRCPEEF
ncbi:MAG: GNAT family N-acetyltransferase [Actinomycetota bacterium]